MSHPFKWEQQFRCKRLTDGRSAQFLTILLLWVLCLPYQAMLNMLNKFLRIEPRWAAINNFCNACKSRHYFVDANNVDHRKCIKHVLLKQFSQEDKKKQELTDDWSSGHVFRNLPKVILIRQLNEAFFLVIFCPQKALSAWPYRSVFLNHFWAMEKKKNHTPPNK